MSGPRIPETPGVSGTWAALDRHQPVGDLVTLEAGVATTTSLKIAEGTDVQHKNVLELIRDNIDDFAEFGRVAFETHPFQTAGGVQQREVAYLTEEHATLLLTYMRNSALVRDFKKRLVREFWQLRRGDTQTLAIPQTYAAALRAAADQAERADLAESKVRELAGPASSWNELAEAAGDYSVADAAKVLSRDPQITTGERRLFESMRAFGWIYREGSRWRAYQKRVEDGRLTEKVGKPYLRDGVMHNGEPTVRVTPKGLTTLHKLLGGSGQLALVAVS